MADQPLLSPLVALDTNFLIDLADDNEACWDCITALREVKHPPKLVATVTVLQELAYLATHGTSSEKKRLARKALQSFVSWGINPMNFIPVGNGIVELIGDEIRRKGLLPEEEKNDSYVIAEAALANCQLLISSDSAVTNIDRDKLRVLLDGREVEPLVILWPQAVVRQFGKRR